ncbi:hypothetical protein [Marispirochaeta sp.]|uniref:ribonuclease toxin HepT-like protein n=1 Tax=Marispirochaeta sp. TaxID=2038653 RepID=UPI0029C76544|nr:hypothetical protein [Marispirochaeta sp.]
MKNSEGLEQLRSELRQDLYFIKVNHQKNREMSSRIEASNTDDEYQYAALGYTLHNLYTAFESYFLRIAKFFENNLDAGVWHSSLLERMTLDIEGVRPSLFDLEFSNKIGELMRFRHLFRNLYKTPLIPQKVLFANQYAKDILHDFIPFHEQFDRFLLDLKGHLEDGES